MIDCPSCNAPLPLTPDAVAARAPITCAGCGFTLDLDPVRREADFAAGLKRTFRSAGPLPTTVRRYAAETTALGDDLWLARVPALDPKLYATASGLELAIANLAGMVRRLGGLGRLPTPLPPSDAGTAAYWVEASDALS